MGYILKSITFLFLSENDGNCGKYLKSSRTVRILHSTSEDICPEKSSDMGLLNTTGFSGDGGLGAGTSGSSLALLQAHKTNAENMIVQTFFITNYSFFSTRCSTHRKVRISSSRFPANKDMPASLWNLGLYLRANYSYARNSTNKW